MVETIKMYILYVQMYSINDEEQFHSANLQLQVRQQIEPLEIMTGIETLNKYAIQDITGAPLFMAYEMVRTWES